MLFKCPVCNEHADPLRKMARASLFGLLMGDEHGFYCNKCLVYRLFSVNVSVNYDPGNKENSISDDQISKIVVPFQDLALGVKFKYTNKAGNGFGGTFVKIGINLIAEWDKNQVTTGWVGQGVYSFADTYESSKVEVVES